MVAAALLQRVGVKGKSRENPKRCLSDPHMVSLPTSQVGLDQNGVRLDASRLLAFQMLWHYWPQAVVHAVMLQTFSRVAPTSWGTD